MKALAAVAAAIFLSVLAPVAAQAQSAVVSKVSAGDLVSLLRSVGIDAGEANGNGDPVVIAKYDGVRFLIRTFDCDDGDPVHCERLMFFANFPLDRPVTADDYEAVNAYNDRGLFGRGYVLESQQQIGVDLAVNLRGGVTVSNLADDVRVWASVLSDFAERIGASAVIS